MAVDNNVVLQLGYGGLGTVGENHHVAPIHPEYAELPKKTRDIEGAKKLIAEAGAADYEHDLITIEDDWQKNTGDAIAAQLREAGIKMKRTASRIDLLERLDEISLLDDHLDMRPLGVHVSRSAIGLAKLGTSRVIRPEFRRQAQRWRSANLKSARLS
jgi:hypothetical protein